MANSKISNVLDFLHWRDTQSSISSWHPYMTSTVFYQSRLDAAFNLYRRDLFAHFGCVNAIEFSKEGDLLISGGDDKRVLLWNLESSTSCDFQPIHMKEEHSSNIFCLAFDSMNQKIFSAGNDEQVIVHDVNTRETVNSFLHEEAIYGVSVNPYVDSLFASAGEDGQVLLFDTRKRNEEPLLLARSYDPFHAVQFHPVEPRFIVTANPKEGVVLWDIRKPRVQYMRYGDKKSPESSMCARFNGNGTQIIALRRRLPPILFNTHSAAPVCQFDAEHYYNSCTMKSCCFAGSRDQFVLSGSDDFNLYLWRIPDPHSGVRFVPNPHLILQGHRSIVNQVRFNSHNFTIASSGVEKIVKLWNPVHIPGSYGNLESERSVPEMTRRVYTHEEYIELVLDSGQSVSHDYSQGNTVEDPRMMAFFDSLVQREVEGWTTNTDDDEDASSPANSSSNVPSAQSDDSDSDSGSWSQSGSSHSTTAVRHRRPTNLFPNLDESLAARTSRGVHNSRQRHKNNEGSEWILRLIAKKRAQIKAAKMRRKQKKTKLKRKSQKFIKYLTSSRSRRYMYQPTDSSSIRRPTTTSSAELIRRRHVIAPYTIMSLSNYLHSDEEEEEDESDEEESEDDESKKRKKEEDDKKNKDEESLDDKDKERKKERNDSNVNKKRRLDEGISSTSSNNPTSESHLLKRRAINLWSSDESSNDLDEKRKKKKSGLSFRRKIYQSIISSDSSLDSPPANISKEFVDTDSSSAGEANGGASRLTNIVIQNGESSDLLETSDINLRPNSTSVISDNSVNEEVKNNVGSIMPISAITIDDSGTVLFDDKEKIDSSTIDIVNLLKNGENKCDQPPIRMYKSGRLYKSLPKDNFSLSNNSTLPTSSVFPANHNKRPNLNSKSSSHKFRSSLVNNSKNDKSYNSSLSKSPKKFHPRDSKKASNSIGVDSSNGNLINNANTGTPDSGTSSSMDSTLEGDISVSHCPNIGTPDSGIMSSNNNETSVASECTEEKSKVGNEITFKKKVSKRSGRNYRPRFGDDGDNV